MIWTIFIVLLVLKFFELITTSWLVISLIGVIGFLLKIILFATRGK